MRRLFSLFISTLRYIYIYIRNRHVIDRVIRMQMEEKEENIEKDESDGSIGIIYPPPDVRAIVDKTATFVARNGKHFEAKIMSRGMTNLKFGFLRLDDPYRAYYDHKVKSIREDLEKKKNEEEEKVDETAASPEKKTAERVENTETAETTSAKISTAKEDDAQNSAPREKMEKEKDNSAENDAENVEVVQRKAVQHAWARFVDIDKIDLKAHPPKEEFTVLAPHNIPMLDDDIVKLTAQYTAASGRDFLAQLARREHRNPQFSFLRPTHVLFRYFMCLVDQYSKCLHPSDALTKRLRGQSKTDILKRCVHRLEFQREAEAKRKALEAEKMSDRVAYQSIDWHDFVIVETIEFVENEAPAASSKEREGVEGESGAREDEDMDMDMDMDEGEDEEDADVPVDDEEEIEVRENYTPSIPEGILTESAQYFVDQDGEKMAIEESSEIMRIKNLDPRWREQQLRAREKTKVTALATGEDLARNLMKMASHRQDVFGNSNSKSSAATSKVDKEDKVIWDGDASTVQSTQHLALKAAIEKPSLSRPPPPPPSRHGNAAGGAPIGPAGPRYYPRPVRGFGEPLPMKGGPRGPIGRGRFPLMMHPSMYVPPRPPMGRGRGAFHGARPPPPPPSLRMGARPIAISTMMPRGSVVPRPVLPPPPPSNAASVGPPAKRPRVVGTGLVDENEWAASHPDSFDVTIVLPNDSTKASWNLRGQRVTVTVGPRDTLRDLKDKLSDQLGGMPRSKQQLKLTSLGFLKDKLSMAYYNLEAAAVLELSVKTRGRKR